MGMNTVIHILNDALHELEEDPKGFVDTIKSQMNSPRRSNRGNAVKVMPCHHASDSRYYISGGNTISEVSFFQVDDFTYKSNVEYFIKELDELIKQARKVKKYAETRVNRKEI